MPIVLAGGGGRRDGKMLDFRAFLAFRQSFGLAEGPLKPSAPTKTTSDVRREETSGWKPDLRQTGQALFRSGSCSRGFVFLSLSPRDKASFSSSISASGAMRPRALAI